MPGLFPALAFLQYKEGSAKIVSKVCNKEFILT